ncbi:MAG: galE 3, partial [Xanthobacteraceae bacterium]|nr:galE 3 [Xanthobacteraceae bacterium]
AHGLAAVSLRYFPVAGASGPLGEDHTPETHLIPLVLQAAAGKRPSVAIFGTDYPTPDGTCVRDYIHVADLVAAHAAALKHLRASKPSHTFNCGYGHGYSVLEVLEAVKRVAGRDLPVTMAGRRPGDPAMIVADCSRIRQTLGWVPKYDNLDTIVSHALAWERRLAEMGKAP